MYSAVAAKPSSGVPNCLVKPPAVGVATASGGEFRFTEADFQAIASILRAEAGITLPSAKSTLVYARLAKRVRTLGLADFAAYVSLISSDDGVEERGHLVTALTTNVTKFFREPHHFEHLRASILPALLRAACTGARIRLWSAACSTGQEPYSLAAVVAEMMPDAGRYDVRILATDIDPLVLEQAKRGRYPGLDGMPAPLQRWFERDGQEWVAGAALKSLVTFRSLNLTRPWPMRGPFDAVMCRNVAIYFDAKTQSQLWHQFSQVIGADGMLYIGHSERLAGPAVAAFDSVGVTAYRRKSAQP